MQAIKTPVVTPSSHTITELLASSLSKIPERSVVAVSSKVLALCEGRVVAKDKATKAELIVQEASQYLPAQYSQYGKTFTITDHTLIAAAGLDESNAGDYYILWPKDSQASANAIRDFLVRHYDLTDVGVIITDSTCQPSRLGTTGIVLAHSGFAALNDYIGQPDLFGRPFAVSRANVANGLAATATVAMGEGTEQTPLGLLTDIPFVTFQSRNPSLDELKLLQVPISEDVFAPFLEHVDWQPGKGSN